MGGSGVGESVIGAVLAFNVTRGIGVELSDVRFTRSCEALARLRKILGSDACGPECIERLGRPGQIDFLHANILDVDLSTVTAVTMYSTCFPPDLQRELQRKLLRELPLGARVHATDNSGW